MDVWGLSSGVKRTALFWVITQLVVVISYRRFGPIFSGQENCTLLGYYTANSGNFLPTFRDNLSVPSSGDKNPPQKVIRNAIERLYCVKEVVPIVNKLFLGTKNENWVGLSCLLCYLLPEEQGLRRSGHRVGFCFLCSLLTCELAHDIP